MTNSAMPCEPRILLELTVSTVDEARAAIAGGADRLELCAALQVGGLSPSPGLVECVLRETNAPLVALLRPRAGSFSYTTAEFSVLRRDLDHLLAAGVSGVALGVLRDDCTVDEARCRELIRACADREVVFHRAFDLTPDPFAALALLMDLGVRRVLTGGGHPRVVPPSPGAAVVAALIELAAGRIEILPAGGIRSSNVLDLLRTTRCAQVHSSCRSPRPTPQPTAVALAGFGFGDDGADDRLDPSEVVALRRAIDAGR